jgi:hypothetical protein
MGDEAAQIRIAGIDQNAIPRAPWHVAERRLALVSGAIFLALLALSAALWIRYGDIVYFERLVQNIPNCF